jgi:hypothetical protein
VIIAEIIARLNSAGTPFAIIEGVNELAEVKDRPRTIPAAFVYVATEASLPNERMSGRVFQRTETDIAVLIITENHSGKIDVARDIESLKAWVRGRLIGFKPASASDPIEHAMGQIQNAKDRMVWFEDVFATAYYQTEQP